MSNMLEAFDRELKMIQDDVIRDFTEHVLRKAPMYFWLVPSSSTGKHHPLQDQGQGGLVRHSKAVAYFGDRFCQSYNLTGKNRDLILSACILHDIVKYGFTLGKWTTKTHGKDGAEFIFNVYSTSYKEEASEVLDESDVRTICRAVFLHMGRWTDDGKHNFPEAWTTTDLIVHLADMMSASKEVSLGFLELSLIG